MTVLVQVSRVGGPGGKVSLALVFLKTLATLHSSHVLQSGEDRKIAKMPPLVPATEYAQLVRACAVSGLIVVCCDTAVVSYLCACRRCRATCPFARNRRTPSGLSTTMLGSAIVVRQRMTTPCS